MGMAGKCGRAVLLMCAVVLLLGCAGNREAVPVEPSEGRWGIYRLDLSSGRVALLYGAPYEITAVRPDPADERLVFSQRVGGDAYEYTEILTLGTDGRDLQQLTDNDAWDLYPAWSPDGSQIAFLSWRRSGLDIYVMAADGSDQRLLYGSDYHDADIDWGAGRIVFTRESRIWVMDDGSDARPLTEPPRAGERGRAELAFGDYDPRLSPDGSRVVFSRLVGDESVHGNYDLFAVDIDGSHLTRLTATGYAQGLASWSHRGDRLLYVLAAVGDEGRYDLYVVNADGSGNRNITPRAFPARFLIHWAAYTQDDTGVYLIAEWWPER